jgi:H+/Cl- antiporter ClcA
VPLPLPRAQLAGVFFGLELATNRWRAELTWRTLLTCACSVWTAQLLSSFCQFFDGVCGKFEGIGLFHIVTNFDTPWRQVNPNQTNMRMMPYRVMTP